MRTRACLGLMVVSLAGCPSPAPPPARPHVRMGFMICNSRDETLQRFGPLAVYLGEKLGVAVEAVALDTVDFTKHVDTLDFTHTNSLLYVIMARLHGVQVVAGEKAGNQGIRTQGAIITQAQRPWTNAADLRGATLAFGPALGPTSYMSQLDILQKAGLDPDTDLASYSFPPGSFKHEKVVYGVLFGKYDAGAVPLLDLERMTRSGRLDPADLKVLALGEPIPYCTVAATQRADPALVRQLRETLLALGPADTVAVDGETVKVLSRANVDGYQGVHDRDYDGVRAMAKRTNMPPYQRF